MDFNFIVSMAPEIYRQYWFMNFYLAVRIEWKFGYVDFQMCQISNDSVFECLIVALVIHAKYLKNRLM